MSERPLKPYHEMLPELETQLRERGSLGLVLLDASNFASIELEYGRDAFEEVRQRLLKILREQGGKDYRAGDLLAVDEPEGLRFLLFLDRKRRKTLPVGASDLRAARTRLAGPLATSLARAAFPYRKTPLRVHLGQGIALFNPLLGVKRIVERAFADARETVGLERRGDELATLERLQDLIARERIVTAYQPIVRMKDRVVVAYEALSRGARGSGLEAPDVLFGAAESHSLLIELDRLCRSRALLSSSRVPGNARIFVNTLPATIRDPQFRGKPLIDFLDRANVAPSRIVIEITEKLVIENYSLFRETMAYFADLGMSFAVDDVGAGYSGLEAIARLKPTFLKIDMALVRDVHTSLANREMVRAIISMGHAIGASVLAEGIQSEDEAAAILEMNADLGQGFLFGRPDPGPEPA
jgi:EAL domain-containing protein (putative c-di-GMP-specific phosphodiesterase class I)